MCLRPIYVKSQQAMLPCRQCLECRLARAKEWGVRCYYEGQSWDCASFITLTYAPEHNPVRLQKKHLQDFIKRLRSRVAPLKIKYFACGEYGSKNYRPHYHIIIFGYDFPDRIKIGTSSKDKILYASAELSDLWKYGYSTVQDCSVAAFVYCALYSAKPKKLLPKALQLAPEFNLMSQGLGVKNIAEGIDRYLLTDQIYVDGQAYKIPEAVLRKLYVKTEDGRIIEKDQILIELKEKRLEQFRVQNRESVELSEKIIFLDEKIEAGASADRLATIKELLEAEQKRRKELFDRNYRKRHITKKSL